MTELPDPLLLIALAQLFESATIVAAAGVSLCSRSPSRRDTALQVIRMLRRHDPDGHMKP